MSLALTAASVGPSAAYSLRDALAAAYRNSDLLDQNRYLLRLQDEGVALQLAGLRPIFSFIAESTWSDSDVGTSSTVSTLSIVGELLLYDNGGTRLLVEAARESVYSARQSLVSLEQRVLLDAVTAYMNVWRDVQVVQVRQSNVGVVREQLRAARDRFEVGEDTRTDVAQAEASLAAAQSALASAQGQLEISEELFIIAVGERPGHIGGPGSLPDLPFSEAEADHVARQHAPDILALQHQVSADELALQAARTDYGPEISLSARAAETYGGLSEGTSGSVSLTLSQPLYRGGQLFALERQAIATLAAARAELNQQVRVTIQAVGTAYAQLRIANAQILSSEQQIRAAEVAFEGVREEASLGARTTLDVLDAEQDLLDARIDRITAQSDLYVAAYTALQAMGLLTVEHLYLPVPEYDPNAYYEAFADGPSRSSSPQGDRLDAVLERLGRE